MIPSSMLYQMIAENKLLVHILEEVQVELEKLSQEQLTLHEQVIAVDQDLQVQMQKRQDGLLLNEKFKQKEEIDARFQMLMKSREAMNELGKRVEFSKKADELTKLENEVLKQQTLYKKEVSLHQAGVEKLADLEQRFII
ncbi:MAG: SMC family ATPase, partial [Turicibacter sanguinis]